MSIDLTLIVAPAGYRPAESFPVAASRRRRPNRDAPPATPRCVAPTAALSARAQGPLTPPLFRPGRTRKPPGGPEAAARRAKSSEWPSDPLVPRHRGFDGFGMA